MAVDKARHHDAAVKMVMFSGDNFRHGIFWPQPEYFAVLYGEDAILNGVISPLLHGNEGGAAPEAVAGNRGGHDILRIGCIDNDKQPGTAC